MLIAIILSLCVIFGICKYIIFESVVFTKQLLDTSRGDKDEPYNTIK